jgi:hypothetical protein
MNDHGGHGWWNQEMSLSGWKRLLRNQERLSVAHNL